MDIGLAVVVVVELSFVTEVDIPVFEDSLAMVASSIHSICWPSTVTMWWRPSSADGQIIRDSESKILVCR
jgi:hypothetical protein